MSLHSNKLSWFRDNTSLLFLLYPVCLSEEATNVMFIRFGLIRQELETMIYRTRGEHANHYATDEPTIYHSGGEHANHYATDEPTIYHTRGEHANHYATNEPTIYLTRGEHANYYATD